jgi:hypothetical protein
VHYPLPLNEIVCFVSHLSHLFIFPKRTRVEFQAMCRFLLDDVSLSKDDVKALHGFIHLVLETFCCFPIYYGQARWLLGE